MQSRLRLRLTKHYASNTLYKMIPSFELDRFYCGWNQSTVIGLLL